MLDGRKHLADASIDRATTTGHQEERDNCADIRADRGPHMPPVERSGVWPSCQPGLYRLLKREKTHSQQDNPDQCPGQCSEITGTPVVKKVQHCVIAI